MTTWVGPDAVRITRDVQRLYELGPRPIYEFLAEIAGDPAVRLNIEICLERYARLDPNTVAALGGRDLHAPLAVVDGDGVAPTTPTTSASAHPVRGAA